MSPAIHVPEAALELRAGPAALALLRERGLRAQDVDIVPGASGGAKWLSIAGLDRFVFGELLQAPRERALHLIGSSIGSWRMGCLAQRDPVAALARGHHAYIYDQKYSRKPSSAEVTTVLTRALDLLLGEHGVDELQFRRRIFHNAGPGTPFAHLRDLPTDHVALTRETLRLALLASGAIPLLLDGVRVPGASPGVHWDGGVLDYHLDLDFGEGDGLVLYPHFYSHVVPGWFDKRLPWRRARSANFARALLIAPSAAFVASLPGGKIPDRRDFYAFSDAERARRWQATADASERLGDELRELVARERVGDAVQPWVS